MIETRKLKVYISKVGGTAGKSSEKFRVALPTKWGKKMGVDKQNRDIELIYNSETKEITIKMKK